ncbi:MAG: diguanylate cyclase [Candidatus Dormiibacterota bacterium]
MSLALSRPADLPSAAPRASEDSRLGFEILLIKLTVAVTPLTLLCSLLLPGRAPALALGSQLIIPAYVILAGGAARHRPRLLTQTWFLALLYSLHVSLIVLQIWAYDRPGSPLWLAFLPALLVGAARWEVRGAWAALAVFFIDRLATVVGFPGFSGPAASRELLLELTVMTLFGVLFGFLFRELEQHRERLRASSASLAASTDLLSAVLENVGEAILTVDDAGLVGSANRVAGELFACAPPALVGTRIDQLLTSEGLRLTDVVGLAGGPLRSEATGQRQDGTSFTAEVVASLIVGDGGAVRILVLRDVTELRARTAELSHQALHDALTGLPNRLQLTQLLLERLAVSRRTGSPISLLLMDLDDFKAVNDTQGHHVGDELLKAVAQRLRSQLRESDLVARLGGDEFAILPGVTTGPGDAERIATKIVEAFRAPFFLNDVALDTGVSIGIASFPEHGEDAEALMRQADSAMYTAKRSGRGWTVADGTARGGADAADRLRLPDLRRAVEDGEMGLRCTPVMSLADGILFGVDAQPRWNHPDLGPLDADAFMPMAADNEVIRPLTRCVVRVVVEQQAKWRDGGSEVRAGMHLSSRNLGDPGLVAVIEELLHKHELPASGLTLFVDEADARHPWAADFFETARGIGLRLAIDDYGASPPLRLSLLAPPFTEIRLSAHLTHRLASRADQSVKVEGIIALAHSQGMTVAATGVADELTLDRLRELHCDAVTFLRWDQALTSQAFGTPLAPDTIQAFLTGWARLTNGPSGRDALGDPDRTRATCP